MLVGMSTTLPSYFWIPTLVILTGGMIFLAVLVRREGISIPWLPHGDEEKLEMEEFEEREKLKEPDELREFDRLKKDGGLPVLIESLNDVECKVLLTLLESQEQHSKKELQRAVKTTYPRVLRAVNRLSKLGLIEVTELPRRLRGAPVQHAVRLSRSVVENGTHVGELVKKRLMKLEKEAPQA
ncbi:MAG: hypothetical protein FGF51_06545 [Candidatus Brockarchaeota archaeon]|nr:hypothetical protein [Candidatus Brockarchaeota archaeon]